MALIAIAIYDTPENGRGQVTEKCLASISWTVDPARHRVCLVVNAQTEETAASIAFFCKYFKNCEVIYLPENVGTAKAINKAIALRQPGEYVVKMDNDVTVETLCWADEMEEAMRRDSNIGILGLKRSDLIQHPNHPDPRYKSVLRFVPETPVPGQPWVVVEETEDVMGTCTMFSPDMLDKIGFMYQPGLYGFDDVLMCVRSHCAGFVNAFLPHIQIHHHDPAGVDGKYDEWKRRAAMEASREYQRYKNGYESGQIPIYSPETW